MDAELDDERVVLTVRDTGHWIERPDGPARYRGNGLPLMEALMDSVELTHETATGRRCGWRGRCRRRPTESPRRPERVTAAVKGSFPAGEESKWRI